jgi:hypothetical protein
MQLLFADLGTRWVSDQLHAPVMLYPRERTAGTHWIGGWVGLGARLDTVWRKHPLKYKRLKLGGGQAYDRSSD